ncbi:unnamed protein product [Boreogadus saida]
MRSLAGRRLRSRRSSEHNRGPRSETIKPRLHPSPKGTGPHWFCCWGLEEQEIRSPFFLVHSVARRPQKAITREGRGWGDVFYMATPLTGLSERHRQGNQTRSSEYVLKQRGGDVSNLSFRVME